MSFARVAAIEHARGSCRNWHMGNSPDLVKVGAEYVTDCVACVSAALVRQGRKTASKAVCCSRCAEVAT